MDDEAIRSASIRGHIEIVRLLLERPEVDISARNNEALRFASMAGHTDIVRMLLKRPEVNPVAKKSWAIRLASMNGHTDIVRMLLQIPEVNPSAIENSALRSASAYGHTDIVRMLEQDDRVKAIEFLKKNRNRLTMATFLNLFDSPLQLGTPSYIESVFAERPNDHVALFMSDLFNIPLEEAKAVNNLEDFDRYIYKLLEEIENNQNFL